MLGISINSYAKRRSELMPHRESVAEDGKSKGFSAPGQVDLDQETKAYLNNDKDNLLGKGRQKLWNLERYELVSKRIW